jgi:hypothetical protein
MEQIKHGDKVRHREIININYGLAFEVKDIENDKALCEFYDPKLNKDNTDWFNLSDLILVEKADGGFERF